MSQPKWRAVAQLGDASPLDYGGYWVLRDTTGAYPEEAELLIAPDEDSGEPYQVYRFILDKCTFVDGVLSDNQFHPEHPAWFATPESRRAERPQDSTYLSDVASFVGQDVEQLIADLCSDNPVNRAHAYRSIGDYHGWRNLDDYPLELSRSEARQRYRKAMYRVEGR